MGRTEVSDHLNIQIPEKNFRPSGGFFRYLSIFQVSIRNQSESIGLYSGIYRKRDWNLFSCHLNMFQMIDPQFDLCDTLYSRHPTTSGIESQLVVFHLAKENVN